MEILNSGSFVPLDSREKIEQLKFTAKELAGEAAKTVGFQNNGPTNQQLALEMWKGAEYMCRAHEEATVKNIFLSSFLEKLRVLARVTPFQPQSEWVDGSQAAVQLATSPSISSSPQPRVPAAEQAAPVAATDEYLGVVPTIEELDRELRPSYADECVPEYDADIEALVDRLEDEQSNAETRGSSAPTEAASEQMVIGDAVEVSHEKAEPLDPPAVETNVCNETVKGEIQIDPDESAEPGLIKSIVLADKEPYNFDGCTVTAVVQLLPAAEGIRKCVVSVRTHDFTPQIAVVDVAMAEALPQILAALGLVFAQYRNELPARVADKAKKEKPDAKKQSKASSKGAKATAAPSKTTKNSETPATAPATNPETGQSQQGLFAS